MAPFTEHVLTFQATGYTSTTITIDGKDPGYQSFLKVELKKIIPVGGDPSAIDWEVIDSRWIKNIYSNREITMSDTVTEKMWLYDLNRMHWGFWRDAVTDCENFSYAGYTNWRLPNRDELVNQVSQKRLFVGVKSGYLYWSKTTGIYYYPISRSKDDGAWCVDMSNGSSRCDTLLSMHYIWPVRDINSQKAPVPWW